MSDGRGGRLWPWVVGVVVAVLLIGLIYALMGGVGPPEPEAPREGAVEVQEPALGADDPALAPPSRDPAEAAGAEDIVARAEEMRAAVRRYERDCEARLEQQAGSGIEGVVADCVERLNGAVDAIVASDTVGQVALEDRLEEHEEAVSRLQQSPPGDERVRPTREVMRSAVGLLEVIRDERYPRSVEVGEAVEGMRAAADELEADVPLTRQQDALQRYFLGAGSLLSAMARPGDPGPGA